MAQKNLWDARNIWHHSWSDQNKIYFLGCILGPGSTWVLSHFSPVQLFVTQWTVARQAPLSIEFSRQEYWNGLPCPPSRDLPDPELEPTSLVSSALVGRFLTTWKYSGCKFFFLFKFIYFWLHSIFLAGHALSLVVASSSYTLVAVQRLLTEVTSLAGVHRF